MTPEETYELWRTEYARQFEERGYDDVPPEKDLRAAFFAGVGAEREACAALMDEFHAIYETVTWKDGAFVRGERDASAPIRSRSNKAEAKIA